MQQGIRRGGQKLFDGHHKGSDGCFHVAGTAPVELAVALRGREGVATPLCQRPCGDYIGMASKNDCFDSILRFMGGRCSAF